jgi:hypothetical protein
MPLTPAHQGGNRRLPWIARVLSSTPRGGPGHTTALTEDFMADMFTCTCGNQTWQIFDEGVRCTTCKTEFITHHVPVAEFNHTLNLELEEELEEV